jgi:hypothetical protein
MTRNATAATEPATSSLTVFKAAVPVAGENSNAIATGDSNIAYILDPFGSTASEAYSGFGHSSDLAAVLFTDGTATATTANGLYDILTAFGPETGTF